MDDVNSEIDKNPKFAKFFKDLVDHKKKQEKKVSRDVENQALATISMVVRCQSGGRKVIPETVKLYFQNNVTGSFKVFKKENKDDPDFVANYNLMLERYRHNTNLSDKQKRNLCDTVIRTFLKEK